MNSKPFTEVREGIFYPGYDSLLAPEAGLAPGPAAIQLEAGLAGDRLILTVAAATPFGEATRRFSLSQAVCFQWEPLPGFRYIFIITGLRQHGQYFSFRLWLQIRIDSPHWGNSWASHIHYFNSAFPFFQAGKAVREQEKPAAPGPVSQHKADKADEPDDADKPGTWIGPDGRISGYAYAWA